MTFLSADAGKPLADIVIADVADRVTAFAAGELGAYLKRISGADFKIIRRKDCPPHTVRLTPSGAGTGKFPLCRWKNSPHDTFKLYSGTGGVSVSGSNGRSALYGVYALLETLGCCFAEPGVERVPETRYLEIPFMERAFEAAFALRNIFRIQIVSSKGDHFNGLEPEHHLPQIDWMAKQRLNHYVFYVDYYRYDLWEKYKHQILDALLDRGFEIEVTHHSILYFCPPDENCDFGDFGPTTYRDHHPDWYIPALRFGAEYNARIELPEVRRIILDRYLEYLDRNPEIGICGLWPNDSPVNRPYSDLSHTDGYLKFWNQAAEELAKSFPARKVCGLAYMELTPPPESTAAAKNFHLWFCRHDDNYMYPLSNDKNRRYLDLLNGWTMKLPPEQIACFHYYGWMPPLIPFTANMRSDLMLYRELKLGGVYGWSGFTYNILGSNYRWARDLYVLPKLLWDPGQETGPLEEEWAQCVFGAASPEIMEFYAMLKDAHRRECLKGLLPRESWISLDLLHELQGVLAGAADKAVTSEAAHRIALLEQVACAGSTAAVRREPLGGVARFF